LNLLSLFRFTDDQYDPELAATIGVDFKVKVYSCPTWHTGITVANKKLAGAYAYRVVNPE
jgi:hypothetical protein